jgi:hypothetical protein
MAKVKEKRIKALILSNNSKLDKGKYTTKSSSFED